MDFVRSVFSDEPDPPKSESAETENKERQELDPDPPSIQPSSETVGVGGGEVGGWSFGGLIKTLATRSESVIETYRRDLKEFGSGLKKEIEVAQGSLETVSHKIDEIGTNVIKGTAQIISQGKDAILVDGHESDSSDTSNSQYNSSQQSLNSKRYSRFDAQVRAIQGDTGTYCDEPEDLDDYNKWKLGFVLDEKSEQIDGLLEENASMKSIYEKVVPDTVDRQTFWCRYFFRVHKLKQAEDLRAKLVKRAISREEEEEELSWDVDDEDDDDEGNVAPKLVTAKSRELGSEDDSKVAKDIESSSSNVEKVVSVDEDGNVDSKRVSSANTEKIVKEDNLVEEPSGIVDKKEEESSNLDKGNDGNAVKPSEEKESKQKVHLEEDSGAGKKDLVSKADNKVASDGKTDSDVSVVSSQRSIHEEEDLGWDEIEDLSIIDEKKTTQSGSPDRTELRKRLSSAAEDDEDLSWDIEDDDEPTKA